MFEVKDMLPGNRHIFPWSDLSLSLRFLSDLSIISSDAGIIYSSRTRAFKRFCVLIQGRLVLFIHMMFSRCEFWFWLCVIWDLSGTENNWPLTSWSKRGKHWEAVHWWTVMHMDLQRHLQLVNNSPFWSLMKIRCIWFVMDMDPSKGPSDCGLF